MKYFDVVNYICTAVCMISIFVVWLAFLTGHGNVDSVAIYTLDRSLPDMGTKLLNQGQSARAQGLAAELRLLDFCVTPAVYSLLLGVQSNAITTKVQMELAGSAPEDTLTSFGTSVQDRWNKLFPNSWPVGGRGIPSAQNLGLNVPYDGGMALPPQRFSPLCHCLNSVLSLYKQFANTSKFGTAQEAAKACLTTRTNIPRQNLVFDDNSGNTGTKALSRTAFLLMMGLALLINLIYRLWLVSDQRPAYALCPCDSFSILFRGLTVIILILIMFLPAAISNQNAMTGGQGSQPLNSLKFYSVLFLPGGILMLAVEVCWFYFGLETDMKRYMYMHPYTFFLTHMALNMLALIENGVFSQDVLFTYYVASAGLAMLYSAVLFCVHRSMRNDTHSHQMGYIALLFLAGMVSVWHCQPYFPTSDEHNFLWLMPAVFAASCFGSIVVVEGMFTETPEEAHRDKPYMPDFTTTAHMLQLTHWGIVMLVVWYFVSLLLQQKAGGDGILSNANAKMNSLNFELVENAVGTRYINF